MEHMVVYSSLDGTPSYHRADDLDAAVRYVEHLRNVEEVTASSIFEMQEVPIEFKTYYRVEVATGLPPTGPGEAGTAEVTQAEDELASGPDEPAEALGVEPATATDDPWASPEASSPVPVSVPDVYDDEMVETDERTSGPVQSASTRFGLFGRA